MGPVKKINSTHYETVVEFLCQIRGWLKQHFKTTFVHLFRLGEDFNKIGMEYKFCANLGSRKKNIHIDGYLFNHVFVLRDLKTGFPFITQKIVYYHYNFFIV